MFKKAKNYIQNQPQLRLVLGVALLTLGFVALITPLTPGALVMLVAGLELLGLRFLLLDRVLARVKVKVED